jgi:hypothetical protein
VKKEEGDNKGEAKGRKYGKDYFSEDLTQCMSKWLVRREDVSNFDESGFQIREIKGDTVYVPLDCEVVYNTDADNRELVTVVATINYSGRRILAYIVFKGAYHLHGHFQPTLNSGIEFGRSLTSFTNNCLGL